MSFAFAQQLKDLRLRQEETAKEVDQLRSEIQALKAHVPDILREPAEPFPPIDREPGPPAQEEGQGDDGGGATLSDRLQRAASKRR